MIPATVITTGNARRAGRKRLKVAGYARVSTEHEEQETSFESQVKTYTDMINDRDDWELVEIYTDDGISGLSTKKRPGFQRMINDALAGKIELIIVKSISRMFRNTLDALNTVRQLKERHIEIWFEKENLWSLDPQTEFILSIMASIAQEESRSISKNVYWGKQKLMAQGKGSIAYSNFLGYDKGPNGELVINSEQAETVRIIYGDFLKGMSYKAIGRHLEQMGIPSPMGKETWRVGTVKRILTNEKYKGDTLLGKTYIPDFLTKKQVKNTGQSPMYYVEGSHEAIIEPDVFNRVQEEVAARDEKRYSGMTIFSSKIICGECGRPYGSKVHHSNDKYRKVVWRCNGKYEGSHKCRTPLITQDEIKEAFLKVLNSVLVKREEILSAVSATLKVVQDTKTLEKKQADLSGEMRAVADMINGTGDQTRDSEMSDENLIQRYTRLKSDLEEVKREIRAKRIKKRNVEAFMATLKELPDVVDKFDEILWVTFVEMVTIYSKEDIRFTLTSGQVVKC